MASSESYCLVGGMTIGQNDVQSASWISSIKIALVRVLKKSSPQDLVAEDIVRHKTKTLGRDGLTPYLGKASG